MNALLSFGYKVISGLNWLGEFLPKLGLRLLLAYEFWESGVEKLRGETGLPRFKRSSRFPSISFP